jgi:hypothetical protein
MYRGWRQACKKFPITANDLSWIDPEGQPGYHINRCLNLGSNREVI